MDKRQVFNKSYFHRAFVSRVKFGEKGSIPMDQSYSKSFNVDPNTGRPMNDVQRLVKEQNDLAMQAAFAQLHEFKSEFLPKEVSDSDALKFMCPRLAQLPSELLSYKEGLTKYQLKQQQIKAEKSAFAQRQKDIESFYNSIKEPSKSE